MHFCKPAEQRAQLQQEKTVAVVSCCTGIICTGVVVIVVVLFIALAASVPTSSSAGYCPGKCYSYTTCAAKSATTVCYNSLECRDPVGGTCRFGYDLCTQVRNCQRACLSSGSAWVGDVVCQESSGKCKTGGCRSELYGDTCVAT